MATHERNHCVYEFGPFQLDATRRLLLKEGEPVKLFPKEFDTLLALVESNGELLEKDDLMHRVWQDAIVEESNLTTNISHLRKVLGETRDRHDYIVTVPGRGYRFVAGVRQAFDEIVVRERTRVTLEQQIEGGLAEDVAEPDQGVHSVPANTATVRRTDHPLTRRWLFALAAIVIVGVAFGSYRFIKQRSSRNLTANTFGTIELIKLSNSGRATLGAMSPDGRYIVHVSKDADGESLWLKQVATQSNVQIAAAESISYWGLTFSPDGEYIYCVTAEPNKGDTKLSLIPVLGGPARRLPVDPHGPVSFSPDGRRFAFINSHKDVYYLSIADADGSGVRQIAKRGPPEKFIDIAVGPVWSPGGDQIACAVRRYDGGSYFDSVIGINVTDGTERSLTARRWSAIGQIAWLPNDDGLVMAARETVSAPFQIWHLPLSGEAARRVTNDLNNYQGVSYNPNSGALLAVQTNVVSGVWVAAFTDRGSRSNERGEFPVDADSAIHIASASGRMEDVTWTPDGRLIYVSPTSAGSEIWVWDQSGQTRQLTIGASNLHGLTVSPDGRHLVFSSDRSGSYHLWRVELSGGEPAQLTDGEGEVSPCFSPDGQWIVYQRGFPTGARIWRMPASGGEPVALTEKRGQKPDVSFDGKLIAYHTLDSESNPSQWIFGLMSFDGGPLLKRFTFASTVENRFVRWVPGGSGLAYLDRGKGSSNIFVQPLDGGEPRQLTYFKDKQIESFDWSRDGQRLAVISVVETSDVVLIEARSE